MSTPSARALFIQGQAELCRIGAVVAPSSWHSDQMAVVVSCETVPNTCGHPRHEFIAVHRDGRWHIQRSAGLRRAANA